MKTKKDAEREERRMQAEHRKNNAHLSEEHDVSK